MSYTDSSLVNDSDRVIVRFGAKVLLFYLVIYL